MTLWKLASVAAVLFISTSVNASIVHIETSLGGIDIELFDDEAPVTVANFMNYVNDGDYDNSFFHRSVPGFILQGGGFRYDDQIPEYSLVPTDAPIVNEFDASRSNLRGTLAMAKIGGDPDSATSQWFVNLSDNSANLDSQNGGFTVFGRVIGNGMDVVDAISALPRYNLTGIHSAYTDVPLNGYSGSYDPVNQLVFINDVRVIATPSDFDADSDSDVLLRDMNTGLWRAFMMETGVAASNGGGKLWTDTNWVHQASADFDGDGDADVLLRHPDLGYWRWFEMEGGTAVASGNPGLWSNTDWEFAAAADFDGDGDADVLIRRPDVGYWRLFEMEGGVSVSSSNPQLWTNTIWEFVTASDLDGDGDADILMRRTDLGYWRRFEMEGGVSVANGSPGLWTSTNWEFRAAADFDKDGDADILMRRPDVGYWRWFEINSGSAVSSNNPNLWTNTSWEYRATGDYDGDGDADVLMRNPGTGFWRRFTMEAGVSVGSGSPGLWTNTSYKIQ